MTAKAVTRSKLMKRFNKKYGMTTEKEKTVRVLCYVPVDVKKTVQERRANDPRPSPPSENACYLEILRDGLAEFKETPVLATESIFRIAAKKRQYFAPVGIRMPESLHRELKAAAKQVPQFHREDAEPVSYRFIDLVACLLTRGVSGFQIQSI